MPTCQDDECAHYLDDHDPLDEHCLVAECECQRKVEE